VRVKVAVAVALVALVAASVHVALWQPQGLAGQAPDDGFVRVPGVVHIHTTLSDGAGSPADVVRAARATGTKFVVITDHNNVDSKSFEGYHDGVLVIAGSELSTTSGHVLGLGLEDPRYRFSRDPRDALEDIHDLGGFAAAAHPTSPRADLRFTGWDLPGPWGVEVVNGDSEWRSAGWRMLLMPALYVLNQRYALLQLLNSPEPMLARWDRLLADRDVTGLAGTDAHGAFLSYASVFGLIRNYAVLSAPLTGHFDEDRRAILDALQHGRAYIGVDALANAGDFSFVAEAPGRRATMGDTVPASKVRLKASGRMPVGARLQLVRDGQFIVDAQGALDYDVSAAGVYRIEVHIDGARIPWILSNPIYVFDASAQAKREERAAWPTRPAAPAATMVLDDFEGRTAFQPGSDSRSTVGQPVLDPHGGSDGRGAARFEFRLGEPAADHPGVFAALVDWTHRDLRGDSGLVFSVRADGAYRMWVQVRGENTAAEDGTDWWLQSVRTSTDWQRITVPFAHLRSVTAGASQRLDLQKVRAIVFVVDRGSVKPGTHGTIWLDNLGVY
jgi:hypothetical protein